MDNSYFAGSIGGFIGGNLVNASLILHYRKWISLYNIVSIGHCVEKGVIFAIYDTLAKKRMVGNKHINRMISGFIAGCVSSITVVIPCNKYLQRERSHISTIAKNGVGYAICMAYYHGMKDTMKYNEKHTPISYLHTFINGGVSGIMSMNAIFLSDVIVNNHIKKTPPMHILSTYIVQAIRSFMLYGGTFTGYELFAHT